MSGMVAELVRTVQKPGARRKGTTFTAPCHTSSLSALSSVAVDVETPPITGSFSATQVYVVPWAPSNVASTCGARLWNEEWRERREI